MKKSIKKGFTLVELLVVIAIIAILSIVGIVGYVSFTNRARISNDTTIVTELNRVVQAEHVNKKPSTMQDVVDEIFDAGFDLTKLTPTAAKHHIVYDFKGERFYLLNESYEIVGGEKDGQKLSGNAWDHWKVIQNYSEVSDENFSHYLGKMKDDQEPVGELTTSTGIDVGANAVSKIKYERIPDPTVTTDTREVVIRTNSKITTLTIDAESDIVHHYDELGALNIVKTKPSSYHENGKVAYAEIAYGRIVLESGSKVEEIHVNKKTDSSFDTVIIANKGGEEELPDRITRDAVTVSEETLVVKVESNGSSESVYVYADGATGTKGSTQKITEGENKQNENVNSALGQLVLDNGTTSDKAQTAEEKAEAKDAAASEAVSADFANQEGNNNYVARIGQTGFMSLLDAIEVANASENPVTISLLKDVQQSGSLLIRNSVSINGGNHIITTVGTATSGNMAAFDICDTEQKSPIIVNVKDLTINSTKHSRVFLLNADYCSYDNTNILNVNNLIITTDGQALYSNGPATINARNCEIKHEGQYLSGKDPVYYSAIIVGYNGTLNIYDSKVSSFGNGASTFPSGGTINIYNTEITAFDDFVDASTGYLFWARHEKSYDTGIYKDWCGSAVINVYSGVFEGPYKITHDGLTSANRIAAINIYGGFFEQNPSEYVQDGHSSQQNQDGTWTVK